jgi:endonuclease YncB( thermonuclease family)
MFRFLLRLFGFSTRSRSTNRSYVKPTPHLVRQPIAVSPDKKVKPAPIAAGSTLRGKCYVIDGDTIHINSTRIRLAGIDAPELEDPWGKKAKWEMVSICKGKVITAKLAHDKSYDRIVATCFLPDGTDISAELVRRGLALDWAKFSGGKYRHLEPVGVRKKLWRVAAKHQGKYF